VCACVCACVRPCVRDYICTSKRRFDLKAPQGLAPQRRDKACMASSEAVACQNSPHASQALLPNISVHIAVLHMVPCHSCAPDCSVHMFTATRTPLFLPPSPLLPLGQVQDAEALYSNFTAAWRRWGLLPESFGVELKRVRYMHTSSARLSLLLCVNLGL
jgi:hypothetical protein